MNRKPVVAGQFYSAARSALEKEVKRFLQTDAKPVNALAAIAPHAGYIYSGAVAGKVFASVNVPKTCIVLSPNHTGMGERAAVWAKGSWEIPTGKIPVNEALAEKLLKHCPELKADIAAHLKEHSLEVELPFLFARQPDVTIVPITFSHMAAAICEKIGVAIAEVIKNESEDILIVTSTDMNHYEDQTRTLSKDKLAIDKVLALDATGLLSTCAEYGISMCGVIPTAVAICACKNLSAKKATLIEHKTSGDVSGDYDSVVGYAGFVIV